MGRSKKPLPLLEGVTIEAVAAEGKCLLHWQDMVVFVPWCVPGDVCDIQLRRKKHSYAEGEVVRFVEYSKVRAVPFCQHFGTCGGCKWQNLPYEEQLRAKQQQVYDQLHRIGKVELPEFRPILGSVQTQAYRNKLDYGCANKRWLTNEEIKMKNEETAAANSSLKNIPAIGFHITGAFDKILPIEKCWLMDDLHNKIRNEIRDYAISHGLTFFDLRAQTGLLRDVIIRNSQSGEWMDSGVSGVLSCGCPVCAARFAAEGVDLAAVRAAWETDGDRFLSVTGYAPETGFCFADSLAAAFFRAKGHIVSGAVAAVADSLRSRGLEIGMDLYAPFMAPFVGQDYAVLSRHADFIKPMLYRMTFAPAGMGFEYDLLRKAIPGATGYPDFVMDVDFLESQLAAMESCPCAKYPGIEINWRADIAPTTPEYVTESLAAILRHHYSGAVLSWNIMEAPDAHIACLK